MSTSTIVNHLDHWAVSSLFSSNLCFLSANWTLLLHEESSCGSDGVLKAAGWVLLMQNSEETLEKHRAADWRDILDLRAPPGPEDLHSLNTFSLTLHCVFLLCCSDDWWRSCRASSLKFSFNRVHDNPSPETSISVMILRDLNASIFCVKSCVQVT